MQLHVGVSKWNVIVPELIIGEDIHPDTLVGLVKKLRDTHLHHIADELENIIKGEKMDIQVIVTDERLREYGLPTAQTAGSAGLDLRVFWSPEDAVKAAEDGSNVTETEWILEPGEQRMFDTGLRVWIKDPQYAGFMFARSGTGVRGLVLGNGTGVIDADYQGPLKVCLWNRGDKPFKIIEGDRVAQLVIMPVASGYTLNEVTDFDAATERGTGGFGSTGAQ